MTSEITAARPGGFLLFACIALAALLLSGCGGGSATLPMDDTADQELTAPVGGGQSDTTSPTESGNPGQSGGAPPAEDSTPAVKFGTMLPLGSPLPDVPKDEVKASAKAASTILNYPGADFMLAAGGTVDGDELVLESSEDSIAWAMYRAEGLGDLDIEIYSIEALPGDLGQNYEVAFSEFVSDDWLFLINSTLPEAEVNLAEADGQFISALGNLYFLVTVDGGDSVRISVSHLLTADENPNDPPDDPPVPFTFIGPLLEMGDSFFSISNEQGLATTFSFDDATQWFGLNGEQISPADLVPGDVLLVEALETGAGWYALGVMLVERGGGGDPGDPGKMVFLEGEILTIGNGQLVLISPDSGPTGGEKVVNYNEETQWFTENGEAGPGDFAPGDFVLVDALLTDSGLLAVAVFGFRTGDPGDPGDPRTYVGELTAIDESTLTLEQEIVFNHNEETLWLGENGEAGPGDFTPGDLVQVDAIELDSGLLALVVINLGNSGGDPGRPGDGDKVTVVGQIDFIAELRIHLIDGTVINYDEHTNWYDEFGNATGPDAFEHGDWVIIEALAFTDEWLAWNVYMLPDDPNGGGGIPPR